VQKGQQVNVRMCACVRLLQTSVGEQEDLCRLNCLKNWYYIFSSQSDLEELIPSLLNLQHANIHGINTDSMQTISFFEGFQLPGAF